MSSLGEIEDREKEGRGEVVGSGGPKVHQMGQRKKAINTTSFINAVLVTTSANKSEQGLNGNRSRNYLLIQNNSAGDVYVSFGSRATILNSIKVVSGGYYEPYVVPNDSVNVMSTVASAQVNFIEGTGPITH